jgi:hypothetical protein
MRIGGDAVRILWDAHRSGDCAGITRAFAMANATELASDVHPKVGGEPHGLRNSLGAKGCYGIYTRRASCG